MNEHSPPILDAETIAGDRPADHKAELRLWLRLLTCATLVEDEIRARLRREFDVTLPRFDLMAQLHKNPDGLTLSELSSRMMVSNGNLTALVERLADAGQLNRLSDPQDRRVTRVALTPEGERAFAMMARAHEGWIADLFAGLSAVEIERLMALLGTLKTSARRAIAESGDLP
jgi:DNA-binding MarR family transcriptional regulator